MNLRELIFSIGRWINPNPKASKVLFYHDVAGNDVSYTSMATDIALFKRHIEIAKEEGFKIVPKITKREKEIQLCFDDGFRGIWDFRSYFVDNELRPTVFLAIKLIDTPGYLSKEEILELQCMGFVFESHAYSHTDLTNFDSDELRFELAESKRILEALLGKLVEEICFPIGYYSDQVCKSACEIGYRLLYSSIPGDYFTLNADGVIFRCISQFASENEFRQIINGGMVFLKSHYYKRHKR